jgi:cytochrome c-type biogenesis protein CcmH/NrfF
VRDRGFRIQISAFRGGLVAFLLLAAVILLVPVNAEAQSAQVTRSEDTAERAIGQIRSPYCPGLMLEVCPSPEADALRDSIRDLASEGMAEAEIVEWMIGRHGEEWRAVPKRSGRGFFAWLLPPLFLVVGAGLLVVRLRRDRRGALERPERPLDDEITDLERARLDAALSEWEIEEEAEV